MVFPLSSCHVVPDFDRRKTSSSRPGRTSLKRGELGKWDEPETNDGIPLVLDHIKPYQAQTRTNAIDVQFAVLPLLPPWPANCHDCAQI